MRSAIQTAREFFRDSGGLGTTTMLASVVSLTVSIVEHFKDRPVPAYWFLAVTLVLFYAGTLSAWREKRNQFLGEQAKRGRPELTASFIRIGGDSPEIRLRLQNSSAFPAVGIHVEDVRNGTKVLRFFPPESIVTLAGETIRCQILENGWQEENDVSALFERDQMMQVLSGGEASHTLLLRVIYLNFDNKAAQKSWVLSFPFWFDYRQQRIVMGAQSVDELRPSGGRVYARGGKRS